MGLESQPGRELLLTLWRWNDGSVMTKCRNKSLLKNPKLTKKLVLRAQSHSKEGTVLSFPLLPHAKT